MVARAQSSCSGLWNQIALLYCAFRWTETQGQRRAAQKRLQCKRHTHRSHGWVVLFKEDIQDLLVADHRAVESHLYRLRVAVVGAHGNVRRCRGRPSSVAHTRLHNAGYAVELHFRAPESSESERRNLRNKQSVSTGAQRSSLDAAARASHCSASSARQSSVTCLQNACVSRRSSHGGVRALRRGDGAAATKLARRAQRDAARRGHGQPQRRHPPQTAAQRCHSAGRGQGCGWSVVRPPMLASAYRRLWR